MCVQRDRVVAELASIRPALAAEQARVRDVEAECAGLRKELDAARDSAVKLAAMLEGTRAELEEVRALRCCMCACERGAIHTHAR